MLYLIQDYLDRFSIEDWEPEPGTGTAPEYIDGVLADFPFVEFSDILDAVSKITMCNDFPMDVSDILMIQNMFATATRAAVGGVKVFCPTTPEAEAFMHEPISLPPSGFCQPHPTMLYVIPEQLRAEKKHHQSVAFELVAVDIRTPSDIVIAGTYRVEDRLCQYMIRQPMSNLYDATLADYHFPEAVRFARFAVNAATYLANNPARVELMEYTSRQSDSNSAYMDKYKLALDLLNPDGEDLTDCY